MMLTHGAAEALPAQSLIDFAGTEWRRTPGNRWRAPVWRNGDTDLSLLEMTDWLDRGTASVARVGA